MRTSTLLPTSLEPLSRKNPSLLVDNDLKLKVLEILEKEGPLNIEDLKNKTKLETKTLKRIITGLEEEGSITKPKTRYNLTEIGKGIIKGFIKPSPDEKLDVLSIVASHPNASTIELLQLRNPEPGYKDIVELYSALDELREKGLVKRNNGGWEVGGELFDKLFPTSNNSDAQTNGTPARERVKKQTVEANEPGKTPRAKKSVASIEKATVSIDVSAARKDDVIVSGETTPEEDLASPSASTNDSIVEKKEEAIVLSPSSEVNIPSSKEHIVLEAPTPSTTTPKPTADTTPSLNNGRKIESPTEKTLQKDPNLGIRISQAIRASDLEKKKMEAVSLLKAAVVKLQGQGEQITEDSLTDKANHSEEMIETLHIFFVLKHDRIRDFLRFASKNAKAFKNAPTAKLD